MGFFDNILSGASGSLGAGLGGIALGAVGSLFGKRPNNSFANDQQAAIGRLGADRGYLDNFRSGDSADYGILHPMAIDAILKRAALLDQDPYTSQAKASQFSDVGDPISAYLEASSAIARRAMSSGGTTGGSLYQGAMAANDDNRAGTVANILNSNAQARIADRYARSAARTALLTGASTTARGDALGDINGMEGLDTTVSGITGGLASQELARTDAQNNATGAGLGSAAGSIAQIIAMKKGQRAPGTGLDTTPTYAPGGNYGTVPGYDLNPVRPPSPALATTAPEPMTYPRFKPWKPTFTARL